MFRKYRKYIFKVGIVFIIIILLLPLLWNSFLERWVIKSDDKIVSVELRFTLSDSYKDVVVSDPKEISELVKNVIDMEKAINICNIKNIQDNEKFQSDPQLSMNFVFDDNTSQNFCIQKDSVIMFERCNKSDYKQTYFLRLENVDTKFVLDAAYLYLTL